MVTKDLRHLLGPCHKVLSGSNRLKINREQEGEWFKNSLVGRGLKQTASEGRGSRDRDADPAQLWTLVRFGSSGKPTPILVSPGMGFRSWKLLVGVGVSSEIVELIQQDP